MAIIKAWTLLEFKEEFGPTVKIAPFTNKEGEEFKSLAFISEESAITLVSFSKVGELTPKQLKAKKHDLRVVLTDNNKYKLCEDHSDWETVDL